MSDKRSEAQSENISSRVQDVAVPSGIPLIRILGLLDAGERQEVMKSLMSEHAGPAKASANVPQEALRITDQLIERLKQLKVYDGESLSFFRVVVLELLHQHGPDLVRGDEPEHGPEGAVTSLARLTSELATYAPHKLEDYSKILLSMTKHIKGIRS